MHCHACDSHLPTDVKECFDEKTERYYCGECGAVITDLIEEMKHPPEVPVTDFPYGVPQILDEDFDPEEIPTEETWPSHSLPPENYDE